MKNLTPSAKNHALKILSSLLLLIIMIPGAFAQEAVPDENLELFNKADVNTLKGDPDKSATYRLNVVGSDALIQGLTVGRGAGTGELNLAFGLRALFSNTTGHENTAIGSHALTSNTTGLMNVAIGGWTLHNNTTGAYNTAVGVYTLLVNETGKMNTAVGMGALHWNQTGSDNSAFGKFALFHNISGFSNIAIGESALSRNTDRSNLVAVGDNALYNNGQNATHSHHATANTALGSKALYANTTGYINTATGFETLYANTTGSGNTATGYQALNSNTTGFSNTATGLRALHSNTTGISNTATGTNVLKDNTTGSSNTAVGSDVLPLSNGSGNTGVGRYSMYDLTSGSSNTAIGASAGDWTSIFHYGTFVGHGAYPNADGYSNITGIGYNVRPNASNQVRIGNGAVTSIGGNVGWSELSDGGYKNNVEEDVAGLDFILKLRPVSYNLDAHRLASDLGEDQTRDEDGSKATAVPDEITQKSRDEKAAIRYTGFVAQEVEATVNELGVAFSGVDAPVNKSGYYGLRYADFVVPLVRAVQEQQAQIEALSPEGFDALRDELDELRQANEQLLAENESIRGQVTDILSMLETLGVDMQDCCQQQTTGRNSGTSSLNQMPDNARLEQNTPNPFHENTLIRYFLPEGTQRAQIIITDMAGTQVMSLPLEHQGAGQVLIHGGTLPSGTYVYTLTVNGRKVDSKRMVLL